ncbi:hypothetical protein IWX64_000006 [Arthrobacter sp. CAN_A212]|uniref:hypothetical protein n=1 Tax=Arthrobacter sp. CAN_A212 TaxID=2787719 RepID=UPI0018C8F6A5
MENDFDVREALDAMEADRHVLGQRMTAETRWAAPAQGLAAALLIAAPAAGVPGVFFVLALSTGLFLAVELVFRKRSGLSISRPAGPRGMALLVLLIALLCGLNVLSWILWALDLLAWIPLSALAGGLIVALGVVGYDRAYAAEVRHEG